MTIQLSSFVAATVSRLAIAWFGIATLAATAWAADDQVRIDFRNKILGVLDAPVFGFDGVSGLDNRFIAELLVGVSSNSLQPTVDAAGSRVFLAGSDAGYWPYDAPQEVVPPPPNQSLANESGSKCVSTRSCRHSLFLLEPMWEKVEFIV